MIKKGDQVNAFMVFFLMSSAQVGVGVLGFQSVINKYAGHDAWISVIVAGIAVAVVIWLIYRILNNSEKPDIVEVHRFTYGRWIGGFLSILFAIYLMMATIVVLRTYVEIIQVWMFPDMKVWGLLLVIVPLIYYIISGQFRVVVGVSFFGVVYPTFLIFTLFFPLKYGHLTNILPVFDHSVTAILQSSWLAMLSFLGISTLLVFYPFISEARKSQKFAQFGNLSTTALYTFICIISFVYYNQQELDKLIWATLGIWKIIELPILARFEYFGIATLFFAILPNLTLLSWSSTRIIHRVFHVSHKQTAMVILIIVFIASISFTGRQGVNLLNDSFSKIGAVFVFIYIPVLFVLHVIRKKVKKRVS